MEVMGETCNHVAPALFRVVAAVCTGLTNPSCTRSTNEWLPCRKDINSQKLKTKTLIVKILHRVVKGKTTCSQPIEKIQPVSQIA